MIGPLNRWQPRRWRRRRNRRCVQGIGDDNGGGKDLKTTTDAAASVWRAWRIGDNDGGVGRGRWARGLDDDNRGFGGESRRDDVSEWTSPTAEAAVCLQAHGIDNNNDGVGRVRRAQGLSDNDGGVGRGQGIDDDSEGLEMTMEAAGYWRHAQGIYDNDKGVGAGNEHKDFNNDNGGICRVYMTCPRDRRQQRRRQQLNNRPNGLETTAECWFSLLFCR